MKLYRCNKCDHYGLFHSHKLGARCMYGCGGTLEFAPSFVLSVPVEIKIKQKDARALRDALKLAADQLLRLRWADSPMTDQHWDTDSEAALEASINALAALEGVHYVTT